MNINTISESKERCNTYHFVLKINSVIHEYVIKIDLAKSEDYTNAVEKLKLLLRLTFPSYQFHQKNIELVKFE